MSTYRSRKGNYTEEEKPGKWDKSWHIALCLHVGCRCGSRRGTVSACRTMCVPMCPMPLGYVILDDLRELVSHACFVFKYTMTPFLPYVPCRVDEFGCSVLGCSPVCPSSREHLVPPCFQSVVGLQWLQDRPFFELLPRGPGVRAG
jgi:hypothetical protein